MSLKKPLKKIAILGSTGSVGRQALEVIDGNPNLFAIEMLSAQNNASLLIRQALYYKPALVVIANELHEAQVKEALKGTKTKVLSGVQALEEAAGMPGADMVLSALVGISGLRPTLNAIKSGKHIALANKETLVVAGQLITKLAREREVNLLPVDSEHSAIYQCLMGEEDNPIEKIYLTASGGPFRGMTREQLQYVTREQALNHPNWNMGNKISIDSASMMNKGLEVIEARWLFDVPASRIDVIIHPQSVVHSIVQFEDGSMKAQMGLPDMKLPIQFALAWPGRIKSDFQRFSFTDYPSLSFEQVDMEAFPCLQLAYTALNMGGNMPCIMNAANEVVVQAFLSGKARFLDIPDIIGRCMTDIPHLDEPGLEQIIRTDQETRELAIDLLKTIKPVNR